MSNPSRRRTVDSLSLQELSELRQLNLHVSSTKPPRRPRLSDGYENHNEYAYDLSIYERYQDSHLRAKAERSAWLKAHRITLKVAAEAMRLGLTSI